MAIGTSEGKTYETGFDLALDRPMLPDFSDYETKGGGDLAGPGAEKRYKERWEGQEEMLQLGPDNWRSENIGDKDIQLAANQPLAPTWKDMVPKWQMPPQPRPADTRISGKDLDKREPKPIPMLNPWDRQYIPLQDLIIKDNLPPVKPGEKLSGDVIPGPPRLTPMDKALDDVQRQLNLKKDIKPLPIVPANDNIKLSANETKGTKSDVRGIGVEMQGASRGGVGGGYSKGGNVENLVERKQMRGTANENDPGYKKRFEDFVKEDEKIFMKGWRKENIKPVKEGFKPTSDQEFGQAQDKWAIEFQKKIDDLKALHPKVGAYAEMLVKDSAQWSTAEKVAYYATVGAALGGSAIVGGMQLMGMLSKEEIELYRKHQKLLDKAEFGAEFGNK